VGGPSGAAVVAYDHAASFVLTGQPGRIVQDVIAVSAEGVFTAVAIGYGFEEERGRPISVLVRPQQGQPPGFVVPADITLGEIPSHALIEGVRVSPRLRHAMLVPEPPDTRGRAGTESGSRFSDQAVAAALLRSPRGDEAGALVLERLKRPEEISFLFNIVDSGTGRELQDQPIHNLASLGKSNGERPFRLLAQPLSFMPRSTIRLQVIEQSEDARGTLFIVLYGYKQIAAGCPEPLVRSLRGSPVCPTETIGRPSDRVIPFDYVARLELTGLPGQRVVDEISVNVEGGFVATGLGYGLAVPERSVTIEWDRASEIQAPDVRATMTGHVSARNTWRQALRDWQEKVKQDPGLAQPTPPLVDLKDLPLRLLPADALVDGIRIRPELVRIALRDDGLLGGNLPLPAVDRIFERLNRPEDVSFRYAIADSGRGIDLQNQPINNVAGLGIATGDRPFKRFARPMVFLPRSTIRVDIEERFGRGQLFVVFHGYKFLEAGPTGTRT
jgi:hypothetical protein